MKTFISYAHADEGIANEFADLLRLQYIDFFLARRSMEAGSVTEQIFAKMDDCKKFVVLISPAALASDWVRREVEEAMRRPQFAGRNFIPVLIEPTPDWKSLHPDIGDKQLVDWVNDKERWNVRLMEMEYNRPRHRHGYYQVGDVTIQVRILAGGNGMTRYTTGDIVCDGPTDDRIYTLPSDIAISAEARIAEAKADCQKRGARFVNKRQVRLCDYSDGSELVLGDKPLNLKLGWTEYFHTRLTNQSRDFVLPCGNSIVLKYGRDLDNFSQSGLSNPIAVNMSVVTSDRKIFVATRSEKMAWNPGDLQPAVSGDGQPEDLNQLGIYDPFRTAIREAKEECVGDYKLLPEHITFFGLARTMGTQFPFLFGEIRLPISSSELRSHPPLLPEGSVIDIEFTVEAVCDWVKIHHLDHFDGRRGGVIGTTLFSLLQSLHYAYPDSWSKVNKLLTNAYKNQ